IASCLGNDFADNVFWRRYEYYKPFARLDDRGGLVIDGYPLPNVKKLRKTSVTDWGWGLEHSRLFLLVVGALERVLPTNDVGQKGPNFSEDESDLYIHPEAREVRNVIDINAKLFGKIIATYRARGIDVIVLAVPTK